MKRSINHRSVLLLLFATLGALLSGCDEAKRFPVPSAQEQFTSVVESHISQYKAAANELQKSTLRTNRKQALERALPDTTVSGWIGTIKKMETTSDGKAGITVQLQGSPILLMTWNNGFSDLFGSTLIEHGSALYNRIASLSTGARVSVSGTFFTDKHDHVRECSVTESGSMTEPEFLFRFSDVTNQ